MFSQRRQYISYLLRMWQTRDGDNKVWRCSLEVPGTGERLGFAGLQDLIDFLRMQMQNGAAPRSDDSPKEPRLQDK